MFRMLVRKGSQMSKKEEKPMVRLDAKGTPRLQIAAPNDSQLSGIIEGRGPQRVRIPLGSPTANAGDNSGFADVGPALPPQTYIPRTARADALLLEVADCEPVDPGLHRRILDHLTTKGDAGSAATVVVPLAAPAETGWPVVVGGVPSPMEGGFFFAPSSPVHALPVAGYADAAAPEPIDDTATARVVTPSDEQLALEASAHLVASIRRLPRGNWKAELWPHLEPCGESRCPAYGYYAVRVAPSLEDVVSFAVRRLRGVAL